MQNVRRLLPLALAIAIAAPAGLGASDKRQRIDSHWRERDVVIDGDNGEWPGPLLRVDPNQSLTAAAVNDGQFLYVVLSTSDAALRAQIMGQGLIVWFDPSGGTKKVFGVKYPVGMAPGDMPGRGRGFRRRDPATGAGEGSTADGGEPRQRAGVPDPPNRLEIYGPEKGDAHSFVPEAVPGIAVKVGQVEGSLVYELKVPIAKTTELPYAIGARNGALLGFGIETPKMERPSREGRGGREGGMGGMGGMGGRGGMGRGGGRGGGMGGRGDLFQPPKPLKEWATIQLAGLR
jgi:hypothetical protein